MGKFHKDTFDSEAPNQSDTEYDRVASRTPATKTAVDPRTLEVRQVQERLGGHDGSPEDLDDLPRLPPPAHGAHGAGPLSPEASRGTAHSTQSMQKSLLLSDPSQNGKGLSNEVV